MHYIYCDGDYEKNLCCWIHQSPRKLKFSCHLSDVSLASAFVRLCERVLDNRAVYSPLWFIEMETLPVSRALWLTTSLNNCAASWPTTERSWGRYGRASYPCASSSIRTRCTRCSSPTRFIWWCLGWATFL